MSANEDREERFSGQKRILKNLVGRDSAFILILLSIGCFLFSLFLSWSQARSEIDLEDKGYVTGWSEGGYVAIMPFLWVLYCVLKNKNVKPKTVIILAFVSIALLVFINVANRAEWIYREYTTTVGNYGGSWRSYTGRNHSSGSDLGAGFWLGLISLLSISLLSLIWSLHRFVEEAIGQADKVEPGAEQLVRATKDSQPRRSAGLAPCQDAQVINITPFEKLNELARLKDKGVITSEEFQQQKALILGTKTSSTSKPQKTVVLTATGALMALAVVSIFKASGERQTQKVEAAVSGNVRSQDATVTLPVVDQPVPNVSSSNPVEEATNDTSAVITRVGECKATLVASISNRLEGEPESGSAITYSDGTFGVSYETVSGVVNSRVDDPISICLESVPQNCPAGDERAKVYKATNLRTNETWSLADSSHSCGGA